MELYVINQELERVGVVDIYESFVWQPEYNRVGSWQLNCPLDYFSLLRPDCYIQCTQDMEHTGIIEDIEKITDEEGNESLQVKGRTLEAILEWRTIQGTQVYDHVQPAAILHQLIEENVIHPEEERRRIPGFEIVGAPPADYGVVSYIGTGSTVLDALESICQEAQLGFALFVDADTKRYTLKLYKGENRTQEENPHTTIEEQDITGQLVKNWDFSSGLDHWEVKEGKDGIGISGIGVYGYMVRKQKVWERYRDEITGERHAYPLRSGYVCQEVELRTDRLYYIAVRCNNPTEHKVGFGLLEGGDCTFSLSNADFDVHGTLYRPTVSGAKTLALGVGNLNDEPGAEGEALWIDYSVVIDLTATFGAGNEPGLSWCLENIYSQGGSWWYRRQVTTYVPNDLTPLVFSRERDVLLEVSYSKTTINERNALYIQTDGGVTVIDHGESGVRRKESHLDLSSLKQETDGVTIPEASFRAMVQREGEATLKRLAVSEVIDGSLYQLTNMQYRHHYHLGDRVICQDKNIGFEANLRITAAEEVWDTSGYRLSLTFGEDTPDIFETIQLVAKGAK